MDEISCCILSNGSNEVFPKNSLSNFSVNFPNVFEILDNESRYKKWFIALNSIGLSQDFDVEYRNAPVMFTVMATTLSSINKECEAVSVGDPQCQFVPSTLSMLSLRESSPLHRKCFGNSDIVKNCVVESYEKKVLKILQSSYVKENVSVDINNLLITYFFEEFTHISIFRKLKRMFDDDTMFTVTSTGGLSLSLKSKLDRLVFVRSDFLNVYEIDHDFLEYDDNTDAGKTKNSNLFLSLEHARELNLKKVEINGFLFVIYVINIEFHTLNFTYQSIPSKLVSKPKILRIQCDNIHHQVYNDHYSKDLEIVYPQFDETKEHYFHEFQNPVYVPLLNSRIDNLSFQILDETNNLVNFKSGPATILSITLKKMYNFKKSFSVRISGGDDFDPVSQLKCILPSTLNFSKSWFVALKQISFSSKFKIFPNSNLQYIIVSTPEANAADNRMQNIRKRFTIANGVYTAESLINHIQSEIISSGYLNINLLNGRVALTSTKLCNVYISSYLAKILGFQNFLSQQDLHKLSLQSNTTSYCDRLINVDLFKPVYFMVYSDLVKESIVSSKFTNLLKVVPIQSTNNDSDSFQTVEFINLDFRALANHCISEISVDIRDHAGNLVQFENTNINLNLFFTNSL